MRIIAIANQKGGTAKTTTTAALAVLLARSGTPTHLIDCDPQGSLTRSFGVQDDTDSFYHALMHRAGLPIRTILPSLTLTPSTTELGRAETELLSETGREFFLRTSLEKTALPTNTVVLLDCPPSLGVLSVNCLSTAGGMIAVVQPGGFELHALAHLHITIEAIRERVNPDLHILGAVITNSHRRRKITEQVRTEVGRLYPLLGTIRADSRLLYATTAGTIQRLTTSKALMDYAKVVEQLQPVLL
ncbi:MAG: AAA family ATPase [Pirellulales bacterium]|nr:AAA family ATPase [Pirellulales bacterium]